MMERPNLNNRVCFADFLGQIIYPEGTPLGLYIVKKYIEEMHGKTSFTSQYQKGSTFTIQLPKLDMMKLL